MREAANADYPRQGLKWLDNKMHFYSQMHSDQVVFRKRTEVEKLWAQM